MDSYFLPNSIASFGAGKYAAEPKKRKFFKNMFALMAGVLLGGVNGAFGAGGGMLAVPALGFILGLDDKKAHATAIAVVLPLCLISAIVYSLRASFDMSVVLPTAAGVVAGSLAGAVLLKKIPTNMLAFLFYGLMLLAGIKMVM